MELTEFAGELDMESKRKGKIMAPILLKHLCARHSTRDCKHPDSNHPSIIKVYQGLAMNRSKSAKGQSMFEEMLKLTAHQRKVN